MSKDNQTKMDELAEQVRRFGDAVAMAEFVHDVCEMRLAQITFFKTREREWLKKSQDLERKVDQTIKRMTSKQQNLFT